MGRYRKYKWRLMAFRFQIEIYLQTLYYVTTVINNSVMLVESGINRGRID